MLPLSALPLRFPAVAPAALAALGALAALSLASCGHDQPPSYEPKDGPRADASPEIVIHAPAKLTSIETGKVDGMGRGLRVACVTCHGIRDAGAPTFPTKASELREFHNGLVVEHGTLGCPSCHVPTAGGEPRLRLADGTTLHTRDTMQLCGQCHGKKLGDYTRGVHGGMNGHWDLTRGPRLRNHCVDCHDPHVPKFQPSRPVLPPKDRNVTEVSHG